MRTDEVPLQVPEGLAEVQKKLKGNNSFKNRSTDHIFNLLHFSLQICS